MVTQKDLKSLLKLVLYAPKLPFDYLFCTFHGLRWRRDWRFFGCPVIQKANGATILIGERFEAVSKPRWNSWGIIQPVMIRARQPGCVIQIGNDVGISGATITAVSKVVIGNRVLIGTGAIIADNDAHPIYPVDQRRKMVLEGVPVILGDDVFIGARAIVLKGVTVGEGSVVGAGSVVTKDVPEFTVVGGNPARLLGDCREITKKEHS